MRRIIPNLTADQKQSIRRILNVEEPRHVLPSVCETLQIQISAATLSRIRKLFEIEDSLANRDDIESLADDVANAEKHEPFTTASVALLKEKAFELSTSNEPGHLNAASRILLNVEKLESQRARRGLAAPELTEALQLEVAKLALLHFGEIGSIRGNKGLADDRKAQMVAERLFSLLRGAHVRPPDRRRQTSS